MIPIKSGVRSLWGTNQALGSKNTAQIAVSDCRLQNFNPPGGSKWLFYPLVGGHISLEKGHVFTIPKRSQRITRPLSFIAPRNHVAFKRMGWCDEATTDAMPWNRNINGRTWDARNTSVFLFGYIMYIDQHAVYIHNIIYIHVSRYVICKSKEK